MPEEAKGAESATDEEAALLAAAEEKAKAEAAANEDDFDKERALKTIRAQRAEEKKLKAELAEYRAAEEAELEKQKSLDQKVAERDAKIKELEDRHANLQVASAFKEDAREKGIADPDLAYLAAEQAGLLGEYDPETGKVEGTNFDKLLERFPVLAAEGGDDGSGKSGDAGRRTPVGGKTPGDQFNSAVRGAIQRRQ